MNLGNICKSVGVVTIDVSWSLQAAAALMMRHHIAALIVTDRGKPVGLISERDLVSALADTGSRVAGTPIREMIIGPVLAISAGESIMRAMALMTGKRVRHLPVFDNSELIGMVTLRDLIEYRLQEMELEGNVLNDLASRRAGGRTRPVRTRQNRRRHEQQMEATMTALPIMFATTL